MKNVSASRILVSLGLAATLTLAGGCGTKRPASGPLNPANYPASEKQVAQLNALYVASIGTAEHLLANECAAAQATMSTALAVNGETIVVADKRLLQAGRPLVQQINDVQSALDLLCP